MTRMHWTYATWMKVNTMMALTLISSSGWAADGDPQAQSINAFAITKETNSSVVMYDVKVTRDCHFAEKDPIDIYWSVPDKDGASHRDGLNFIEKTLYGVEVHKREPGEIQGEVKALRKRDIKIPLRITVAHTARGCIVEAHVTGEKIPHELILNSLRLKDFDGMIPKDMALNGKEAGNGKKVSVNVDLG